MIAPASVVSVTILLDRAGTRADGIVSDTARRPSTGGALAALADTSRAPAPPLGAGGFDPLQPWLGGVPAGVEIAHAVPR